MVIISARIGPIQLRCALEGMMEAHNCHIRSRGAKDPALDHSCVIFGLFLSHIRPRRSVKCKPILKCDSTSGPCFEKHRLNAPQCASVRICPHTHLECRWKGRLWTNKAKPWLRNTHTAARLHGPQRTHAPQHAYLYACMHARTHARTHACTHHSMHARTHATARTSSSHTLVPRSLDSITVAV